MTPLVPLVADDDAPPAVQQIFETTRASGAEVPDLYRALANSPKVLQAWTNLAWPLRGLRSTPRDMRELMILRIAQLTESDYEWQHHVPMAKKVGIRDEQIDELDRWSTSTEFTPEQRAVIAFSEAVVTVGQPDEQALADLAAVMDPTTVVDLTVTAAWYLAVSRVITVLGPFPDHEGHGSQ